MIMNETQNKRKERKGKTCDFMKACKGFVMFSQPYD